MAITNAHILSLLFFLSLSGSSSAIYCICKDGVSQELLQKSIDYACGTGADCSAILQNGACFNPNTVKDHCHFAVNSYFQRKGQVSGSCDFTNTTTTAVNLPNQISSGCSYPTSASGNVPTGTGNNNNSMNPSGFGMGPTGDFSNSVGGCHCCSTVLLLISWMIIMFLI
ncbi:PLASMODESMATA CALLOSE-BINDING PROTEIN 3-like [Impatiens glandulifera]|uniref:PLASMODESMATA CALLOSE-BINDING PROTEIN 3-like n=1 Tax=Impatiens glandulifera TaxID=253017 RepID=UPI001FB15F9B|nr:PLASMODESMATA CALLOSE-BINDING PROTEIN 3-like [Impatiens glandulifera]